MVALKLLEGEEIVKVLRPHPLAFMRYITLCIYFMAMGAVFYALWDRLAALFNVPLVGLPAVLMVWWGLLLLGPLVVGLLHITFWPLLCSAGLGAIGTLLVLGWGYHPTFLGALTIFGGVLGLLLTEIYRRGHTYYITNQRLIMVREFASREEYYIGYEELTGLYVRKGLVGHIFNFGTITPITASGVGTSMKASGAIAEGGVKRVGLRIGVIGAKARTVPGAESHVELFGVPRPEEVRDLIERLRAEWRQVPYLRRIATATEEMLKLVGKKGR